MKAVIRENILDELNTALNNSLLRFNTKIKMNGLPSSSDIQKLTNKLKKGGVSFSEIVQSAKTLPE